MKKLLPVVALCLSAMACACMPHKDPSPSPSAMNQRRLVMKVDGVPAVGVSGTMNPNALVQLQAYGTGTYDVRGLGDCGAQWSQSYKGTQELGMRVSDFPSYPVCVFAMQLTVNDLDAPAIGSLLVRDFRDPSVVPLRIRVNGVEREGVNWVQLSNEKTFPRYIPESKEIVLYPSGKSGKIYVRGCGLSESEDFTQPGEWRTSIFALYKNHPNGIDQTCVFDFLVNNDDTLKQGASVLVSVYDLYGSFLAAPLTYKQDGRRCFEFTDPAVVGVSVNGDTYKRWNKRAKCVGVTDRYEVQGITSKLRIFFGVYNEGLEKWELSL